MVVLKVKKKENPFIYYNNCDDYNEETFTLKSKIGPDLVAESSGGALCGSVVFPGKKSFNYNGESEFYSDEISLLSDFTFEVYLGGATGTTKTRASEIGLSGLAHIQFLGGTTNTFRIIVENASSAVAGDYNYFSFSKSGSIYCLQIQEKFVAYTQPTHFAIVRSSRWGRTFYFVNGVLAGSTVDNTTQPETFKIFIKSSIPTISFVSEFISLRTGVINEIDAILAASFPVPSTTYLADVEVSSIITMRATDTVDIGGRSYRVVNMPDGNTWLAENLDYKIPGIPIDISGSPSTPCAWYYNTDEATYGLSGTYKCGLLYNWYAVKLLNDNKDTLIPGWHVPTKEEWETLTSSIQSVNGSEFKAKDYSITSSFPRYWNGTDDYGFGVIPAGSHNSSFGHFGNDADFWTLNQDDDDGAFRYYFRSSMYGYDGRTMISGYSLRLVKDTPMKIYKSNRVISYTPKYGSVSIGGRKSEVL